jgi:hypothetical protein
MNRREDWVIYILRVRIGKKEVVLPSMGRFEYATIPKNPLIRGIRTAWDTMNHSTTG